MAGDGGVSLGPIRQVAYAVDDLDAALAYGVDVLEVGPFFIFDRIHLAECAYRGRPIDPERSVALAQSGGVQIELIVQHDDEPSAYTDPIAAVGHGAHHLAMWTTEFDRHDGLVAKAARDWDGRDPVRPAAPRALGLN
jgi:hypothetical protein